MRYRIFFGMNSQSGTDLKLLGLKNLSPIECFIDGKSLKESFYIQTGDYKNILSQVIKNFKENDLSLSNLVCFFHDFDELRVININKYDFEYSTFERIITKEGYFVITKVNVFKDKSSVLDYYSEEFWMDFSDSPNEIIEMMKNDPLTNLTKITKLELEEFNG